MQNQEFITSKQWDSAINSIVRKNIKNHGHSRSAATIANHCNDLILEIRSDRGGLIVRENWREEMKRRNLVPADAIEVIGRTADRLFTFSCWLLPQDIDYRWQDDPNDYPPSLEIHDYEPDWDRLADDKAASEEKAENDRLDSLEAEREAREYEAEGWYPYGVSPERQAAAVDDLITSLDAGEEKPEPKYRWQYPEDWLREKVQDGFIDADSLLNFITNVCDSDQIQDWWQVWMSDDGYFTPTNEQTEDEEDEE